MFLERRSKRQKSAFKDEATVHAKTKVDWMLNHLNCNLDYFCCSVAKMCPISSNPIDCSTPGSTVLTISQSFLKLMSLEFAFAQIHVPQIHVTWNISEEISPLMQYLFDFLSFLYEKPISEPMHSLVSMDLHQFLHNLCWNGAPCSFSMGRSLGDFESLWCLKNTDITVIQVTNEIHIYNNIYIYKICNCIYSPFCTTESNPHF